VRTTHGAGPQDGCCKNRNNSVCKVEHLFSRLRGMRGKRVME
jgi:hypothetical protein